MNLLSVCIPTYEMKGLGVEFLKYSFDILSKQTFKDFDVIISDHSKDDFIEKLCNEYKNKLDIHYYKNTKNIGKSSSNINNAIIHATGKLIKILFQDDFLFNEKSLEEIVKNFDLEKDKWLITACIHSKDGINFFKPFYPKYNNKIHLGNNTISSPSVLTILNKNPLPFDENLIWLMDVEYYKRCYNKFGNPKIVNEINVVNRIGEHQVTNSKINILIKIKETFYTLLKKK
ncbi:MAG: glycosyltransferase [Candidatus Nomurabacteria bacterium]|nr:glycosyltransferase [Candidatus Nomurabacteria bacterium]